MKDDDKGFIFTLNNPHGVEPTRYKKREESKYAIECDRYYGPIFGDCDICINDNCNERDRCLIYNDGTNGYECNPEHRISLFVNENTFSVLDYEVFSIDYENRDNINKLCKYPDIIWEYIDTKDISDDSLKQFDDDIELLSDLDAIHCEDSAIRLKISLYYFKNPSKYLPGTQIVNEQYDNYLREWLGSEYDWRLIYRASEHDYTTESFHNYCDNRGPTLIIIKSSGGWIFGGYTIQPWSGIGI